MHCLLDRFQALTSVACDACLRHDLTQLERLILAREDVLADLGQALQRVRGYSDTPDALEEASMEALAAHAHAFEVFESKLVECVRKLRDDVRDALTAASRGRAVTGAYQQAARLPARGVSTVA
ncbi:MAG TPA: hypothetical protein VMV51_09520 [Gemmatimonadaceae bacterium]|nr:hypothetical protein [Gemmatimonadaceae bacterium]